MPTEQLFGAYNFLLEVSGVVAGGFRSVEVTSLEVEGQATPTQPAFRRVPQPESVSGLRSTRSAPAASSHSNVTLKRGLTSADLGQQSAALPKGARKDITILVHDSTSGDTSAAAAAGIGEMPGRLKWQDVTLKRPINQSMGGVMEWNNVTNIPWTGASGNTGQAFFRNRLDSAAHKIQPSVLALGGFVPSGAAVPDRASHQSGRIVLRGPNGTPVAQLSFSHAWPCKWKGPSLKSNDSATVFLVVEQFKRL